MSEKMAYGEWDYLSHEKNFIVVYVSVKGRNHWNVGVSVLVLEKLTKIFNVT